MDENYKLEICAVVFGTDETILNIKLEKDFIFCRKSLIPHVDNLDKIFNREAFELRRDYETARLDEKTLDVICIYKNCDIKLRSEDAENFFDFLCDDSLKYLDDTIRKLRLFKESSLMFKRLSISLKSEEKQINETAFSSNYNAIIPIGEALGSKIIKKFSCSNEETNILQNDMRLISLPFENLIVNSSFKYYDLSYHEDKCVSITLLITSLEILFLNNGKSKKKCLAKRVSVFLFAEKDDRLKCCSSIKDLYKKRSDFVHDGSDSNISDEDILLLRDYTRKCILKLNFENISKTKLINDLKKLVSKIDYFKEM
ncbi:hypothetical protein LAV60_08140 [Clostridium sporogenes]|uniref:HEPN domain-containing protein n=1 Tax=Clostridium sporogenes TaxID=1509 RepID=UPI002237574F|nr:HEPN domain-containing protein [Clostridium sporogenes]MCW6093142.1 hypothetical protein [Clostridium sporogenes]